jgi:hypothetical protein
MNELQCRTVHYHLDKGECRPAQVVKAWTKTTLNLVVALDGANDKYHGEDGSLTVWKTSIVRGTGVGQWHEWQDCPYREGAAETTAEGGDALHPIVD